MFTNNLQKIVTKRKKRIGRGAGSGKGMHTVGRGQKGHGARSGFIRRVGFEGGQTPVHILFPKIGRQRAANKKPKALDITLFIEKNIKNINSEKVKKITKSKNYIIVGPKDYSKINLSEICICDNIKISSSLKNRILQAGGKILS